MADSSTKSARGSNFTGAELNQLCASWMHVSQDPILGSAQKQGALWDRTAKHCNEQRPKDREQRNVRSLETKWSDLKRDVARFSGCFSAVVDAHHSGDNEEDTQRRAKELYVTKDPKSKEFMYINQWSLLKDCPRFSMTMDDFKQKAAQKKARKQKGKGRFSTGEKETDGTDAEGVIDNFVDQGGSDEGRRSSFPLNEEIHTESLHYGEQRPIGNKVAKKHRADESANKIMAQAQRDMAIVSAKRLRLAKSQDRNNLFTIRVADLDDDCQEYFRKSRAKELRIAMLKLQREEEEEERALRRSVSRTPLPVPTMVPNSTGNAAEDMSSSVPPDVPDQTESLNFESSFHAPLEFLAQDPHLL
ncbi:unnamed protein product [Calypogeia fissa]